MATRKNCGLRERHKVRTRTALCDAALALLAEEGTEAVTAERVAERAGVSRRTFFNYFPHVEMVLTANIAQLTEETVEAFVARPASEPLGDSVRAVLTDRLDDPVFAQMRLLEQAATESSATRRFLREFVDAEIESLEVGLRRRLGEDADEVYVATLAASVAATLGRVTRLSVTLDGPTGDAADRAYRDRMVSALDLLFAGFPEPRRTRKED